MKDNSKQHCEYLREEAKSIFDTYRGTWCDLLRWGMPHRANWILSQTPGQRKNQHIVDATHRLALRSSVAGFLEGNTSTTRPWFRIASRDEEKNEDWEVKAWLQHYTQRCMAYLSASNFYHAVGQFYYDYLTVNTGSFYIEELENGGFFFHSLIPGSYYVINNAYGEADILIREFALNVKSVVDTYGRYDENGKRDWSNISDSVKEMYEQGNYTEKVDIVHIVKQNPDYNFLNPDDPFNKKWIELTYEIGSSKGSNNSGNGIYYNQDYSILGNEKFLKKFTTKRKPFIVGKSTENNSEYGENGPMLMSLGLIKSLNKKAIGKDVALEQILSPTLQGPASLRKSYLSTKPNGFVPIDSRSANSKQKLEPIFNVNPAIGAIIQDVGEMRQAVDKFFFADFLLYLSNNPKTRTAAETHAIVEEQQRVIGPNLQSLNYTFNTPLIRWVMDYVFFEDPYLQTPPDKLKGQALDAEFVSVFAQAQRAADLPSIDRYVAMIGNVAQLDPKVLQKVNVDKLADIYEDRLYLPTGLNNPQDKVDAVREQAAMQAQRQQMLEQTLPAVAGAAKDVSQAQGQQ